MALLVDSAALATDVTFLARVTAAAQRKAAVEGQAILGMVSPGPNDKLRLRLCLAIMQEPSLYGTRFAWALACVDTMSASADDATITSQVSNLWDIYAGITI